MAFCYYCVVTVIAFLVIRELLRLLRIRNYGDRYVFITGCDTGFGNLLAKRLDNLGVNVFAGCLTQKAADNLKKSCSRKMKTLQIDVTSDASIQAAKSFVANELPANKGLWAIVNNAGVPGQVAPIEWLPASDYRRTLEVNLFGPIFVTQAFLPLVRKAKGRVVNMASIMGRFAMACGPYAAAKFGVEGYSDQLRRELYRSGVGVHIIEPGYFRTGIVDEDQLQADIERRFKEADDEVQQYYGQQYKNELSENSTRLLSVVMSPKIHKVVDAYEHSILAVFPKPRYVVGWDAQILFRMLWHLPESVADFLVTRPLPTPAGAKS